MAQLRGAQKLWTAQSVSGSGKSAIGNVGTGPNCAVFVSNTGGTNATFKVQVSAQSTLSAGRNASDGTTDGGLTWYDYVTKEGTAVTFTVNASTAICRELSAFSPPFVRLIRTDGGADTTITALVACFGDD